MEDILSSINLNVFHFGETFNFQNIVSVLKSIVFPEQVVKVADFGVSRVQTQSGVMTAETGTYRWMAPEVRLPIH